MLRTSWHFLRDKMRHVIVNGHYRQTTRWQKASICHKWSQREFFHSTWKYPTALSRQIVVNTSVESRKCRQTLDPFDGRWNWSDFPQHMEIPQTLKDTQIKDCHNLLIEVEVIKPFWAWVPTPQAVLLWAANCTPLPLTTKQLGISS